MRVVFDLECVEAARRSRPYHFPIQCCHQHWIGCHPSMNTTGQRFGNIGSKSTSENYCYD